MGRGRRGRARRRPATTVRQHCGPGVDTHHWRCPWPRESHVHEQGLWPVLVHARGEPAYARRDWRQELAVVVWLQSINVALQYRVLRHRQVLPAGVLRQARLSSMLSSTRPDDRCCVACRAHAQAVDDGASHQVTEMLPGARPRMQCVACVRRRELVTPRKPDLDRAVRTRVNKVGGKKRNERR